MYSDLNNDIPDINHGDLMYYVADTFTGPVQSGQRTSMCDYVKSDEYEQDYIKGAGVLAKKDGMNTHDYDARIIAKTKIDVNSATRQWSYQTCSEFGWFQVPSDSFLPLRSPAIGPIYWSEFCQRVFGVTIPVHPNVDTVNSKFGGMNITGSNIVFMTANEDPWQGSQMLSIHDPIIQKDMTAFHIDCPDCSHCVDLHSVSPSDPPALTQARQMAEDQISKWLQ